MASISVQRDERQSTRELRGRDLYLEHADEIRFEDGVWLVPSQHDATSVYEVTLGRRGEFCECADFEHRSQACKHMVAAMIFRAKTGPCAEGGRRFRHRDLYPVPEGDLTYFDGDEQMVNTFAEQAKAYWELWGPLGEPMVRGIEAWADVQRSYILWLRQVYGMGSQR
jgi:hypothetical protein